MTPATTTYAYRITNSVALAELGQDPSVTGAGSLTIDTATGAVTGSMTSTLTESTLVAFGWVPVLSKYQFVVTGISGTLLDGHLRLTMKVRIMLPSVRILSQQVVSGASCQTNTATVNVASPYQFDPQAGGGSLGTMTISKVSGCGLSDGLLTALFATSNGRFGMNFVPSAA